jgi:starvation-inducible DNA-binding protein
MNELIQQLRTLLATNFTLFLKTQMFHWNVEGSDFPQYHDFLANTYTDFYAQNDVLAEYIRIQGQYAPGSLSVYSQISKVKDEEGFPSATGMMTQLSLDNQVMVNLYQDLFDVAEAAKEHGISDYASQRLDAHKKLAWMLRSILKA